jgi:23S rRNA (cytosine1962-C5)-methyltransferase
VRVAPRAIRRARAGHPWIFADDVIDDAGARHGQIVEVLAGERSIGFAFHSTVSKIRLRRITGVGAPPGDAHWKRVVDDAVRHRREVVSGDTDAYRVLFGESDGIPGLVADVYGEHLVIQVLTAGAACVLDVVLGRLHEHGIACTSVLARNDPAVRSLEGLPREVVQVRGLTPDRIEVREHGVRYLVEPWTGQKTGAFLDQRDNRHAAGSRASGHVLDVFAYHGSFGLHAARRAERVIAIDSSGAALARARENAALNGLGDRLETMEGNAFDLLRRLDREGRRFETVLVDPPAFARSRRDVAAARRGYREINLRAMRLLVDGGMLVSSSCSYNVGEAEFESVLAGAAADAGRTFRVLERRAQAPDHPIRLGFPESHYLKCLLIRNHAT